VTLAVSGSQALWYTTRATGIVAFVLLTLTVGLGILTTVRYGSTSWPRFTISYLHRRVSLVTVVFLGIHVVSTALDTFAPIGWIAIVVPFTSAYRPLWLSLGTIAFDLLLAVGISSLLRQRIDARTWRAIHWLSYACWPLALLHAFGTGTDPRLHWVMAVTGACVLAVALTGLWRLTSGWPSHAARRLSIAAASVLGVVAAGVWVAVGPLQAGWAARAGTPASLLGHSTAAPATGGSASAAGGSAAATGGTGASAAAGSSSATSTLPAPPFQASFTGTVSQKQAGDGRVEVDLQGQSTGAPTVVFSVALVGTPDGSGGVVMQQGRGTLGTPGAAGELQGQVVGLQGTRIDLTMQGAGGATETLALRVDINGATISGMLELLSGAANGEDGGR